LNLHLTIKNNNIYVVFPLFFTIHKVRKIYNLLHIITHEDIIRNQYTSLFDVLRSLPGIENSQQESGKFGKSL